jgi:hypothetical protein
MQVGIAGSVVAGGSSQWQPATDTLVTNAPSRIDARKEANLDMEPSGERGYRSALRLVNEKRDWHVCAARHALNELKRELRVVVGAIASRNVEGLGAKVADGDSMVQLFKWSLRPFAEWWVRRPYVGASFSPADFVTTRVNNVGK